MSSSSRLWTTRVAVAGVLAAWPALLFAQTPAGDARPSAAVSRLPGISIGFGVASVGTEGTPWTSPVVASVRIELTRFLVVETEWTQQMRASTFFDSGDVGIATLNGQSGIYGRATDEAHFKLGMTSVAVLARSQLGRVSFLGGAGFGWFTSSRQFISTRTGCTGPWVVACASGNDEFSSSGTGRALVVVGGVDVNVLPRVDGFVSGRIGGSNALEEAALAIGVRTTLIANPSRRDSIDRSVRSATGLPGVRSGEKVWIVYDNGTEERGTFVVASASDVTIRTPARVLTVPLGTVRTIEAADSVMNGLVWGAAAGAGLGAFLMQFDEPRTLPASILIGAAVGAFLDTLGSHRRVVYRSQKSVKVDAAVTPSAARVGVTVGWR